eukprot:6479560-Amphidinium_carterae.1
MPASKSAACAQASALQHHTLQIPILPATHAPTLLPSPGHCTTWPINSSVALSSQECETSVVELFNDYTLAPHMSHEQAA